MADTLALEKLYRDVVQRFADEETDVPNVFGWRKPAQRGAVQNRICWVPGDPSGAAGEVVGAKNPGGNPRSLGTLLEVFTVYIEAYASFSGEPENELKQYKAARLMFDAWFRAVYLARTVVDGRSVRYRLAVKSTAWMVDRTVARLGATLRVVCELDAMIPDAAYETVEGVEAVGAATLDDMNDGTGTSETMNVPPLEET
jgi:hypothetical protein